jgi:hypothetical protein
VWFAASLASLKPIFLRSARPWLTVVYAATVAGFLWICSQFYLPGKGFTYLVRISAQQHDRFIASLKATPHYEEPESEGYDAQHYVQIAMQPALDDPALRETVDNLPYRARRILLPWLTRLFAGGDPARTLHLFAVHNIACWLLLAVLLLRWFPPTSGGNFFRWFGVLFSSGLCLSVRGSLLDGPSLLLVAAAMALLETGRPWCSALVMGISGLGKETNIMAAVALPLPERRGGVRSWLNWAVQGAIVVLPLAAWMLCLRWWLGPGNDIGERNFSLPLTGYFEKWSESLDLVGNETYGLLGWWSILMLVGLTTQWLFLVLRPRWRDPWWRLGMANAVLMLVIGKAVWENYPGAATRVLLPMTLVFNVLVPRSRHPGWWLVLLLGNLSMLCSSDFLKPPGGDGFKVHGPAMLTRVERTGESIEARFAANEWYQPELSRIQPFDVFVGGRLFDYWRWSRGSATVVLHNPLPFPVVADVTFDLKSNDERLVTLRGDGQVLWSGKTSRTLRSVGVRAVLLKSGDTTWRFDNDQPGIFVRTGDPRRFGISLRNLDITVTGRGPPPTVAPVEAK